MLLYNNFQTNYKDMWLRKQKLINDYNKRVNEKQVENNYEVDHYAYILSDRNFRILEGYKSGTFRITHVHTNGSVRIQQGIFNERINIQCLTPQFGDLPT